MIYLGGKATEIRDVSNENFALAKGFLNDVNVLEEIDEDILRHASILINDGSVHGAISYEKFGSYGLIRYFIFRKVVEFEMIQELFSSLAIKALNDGIIYLFSIVNDSNVVDLFESLDFVVLDREKTFIEEERLSISKYNDAIILAKKID